MIGGNTTAKILKRAAAAKDHRGIETPGGWPEVGEITGWLDLASGDSRYALQSAKVSESTHLFLADWQALPVTEQDGRLRISGEDYDIMLIDDPMGMHRHLEIHLKFIGAAES
jgi:hypothetical protein